MQREQWYRPVLYLRWQDHEGGQLFRASAVQSDADGYSLPTDNSPGNSPLSNFPQKLPRAKSSRQRLLQGELTDLLEEREACERQYRSAIDEAQRVRLKRKLDDLDNQIDNIECQMNNI